MLIEENWKPNEQTLCKWRKGLMRSNNCMWSKYCTFKSVKRIFTVHWAKENLHVVVPGNAVFTMTCLSWCSRGMLHTCDQGLSSTTETGIALRVYSSQENSWGICFQPGYFWLAPSWEFYGGCCWAHIAWRVPCEVKPVALYNSDTVLVNCDRGLR